MLQRKAKQSVIITDVTESDACVSVLNQAVSQSSQNETESLSQQSSGKNACSDDSESRLDNLVVKRQRNTVGGDNNCCLLDVSKTRKRETVIERHNKMANTKAQSVKQRLSSRTYKDIELDVLLTPLSERRSSLSARPRYAVDHVGLLPPIVGSVVTPDNSRVSAKAAKISSPQAAVMSNISKNGKLLNGNVQLVPAYTYKNVETSDVSVISGPSHVLKDGKLLNGIVEEDVIESVMPLSEKMSSSCSLIPLQYLSYKNGFEDENAEIDVCVRSFWDEASDPETNNNFNISFSFVGEQVSDDCRVGSRLTTKLEAAASKQTCNAKKREIAKSVKTTISKQRALKNMTSAAGHKNSTRPQSKTESKQRKMSSKDQKGVKVDGSSAPRSCTMTLRTRKKVDYVRLNCKPQLLHSEQNKKTAHSRKEKKSRSSGIQRNTNSRCKRPSRKKCDAVEPVAARTRGRSCSRNPSPPVSSRHSCEQSKPNSRAGRKHNRNQKCGQASRKRITSSASTKPPSKKQKMCKEDNVTSSITRQEANICQAADRVRRKEMKASRSTNPNNKRRSVTQSVVKREVGKRRTGTRKVTDAKLSKGETVASRSSASNKTNSAKRAAVSSSVDSKKTRSVDTLQYVSVLISYMPVYWLFPCCEAVSSLAIDSDAVAGFSFF